MALKWAIIFTCTLFVFCESAYVETSSKCDISDIPCQKEFIQNFLKSISKTGIKELNIDPIDPAKVSGVKLSLLGLLNITIKDGEVTGIKDCVIDDITGDYKEGHTRVELTCNVVVKGNYILEDISPLLQKLLQDNTLTGEGNIKAEVENLKLKIDFYYDFIKKNGDVYFNCHIEKLRYEFEMGKTVFAADKLYLGKEDASQTIVAFLNENSPFISKTYGRNILDIAIGILKPIILKFFQATPVKSFLTNDLSPYVKN